MYRVLFVENVLLHGQNGKKSKKVSFWDLKTEKIRNFQLALEPEQLVREKNLNYEICRKFYELSF